MRRSLVTLALLCASLGCLAGPTVGAAQPVAGADTPDGGAPRAAAPDEGPDTADRDAEADLDAEADAEADHDAEADAEVDHDTEADADRPIGASGESETAPADDSDQDLDDQDLDDQDLDGDRAPGAPQALRYFLEDVEVVGNTRTHASVVRAYVPLERGEPFDPEESELETLQFSLMGTGWFDEVNVRLRRGRQRGWVVVVIEVVERNTVVVEQIALGVAEGLSSARTTQTRVFPYVGLTLTETNLLGRGMRLSVSGLLSRHHQGGRIDFAYPRIFGGNYGLRAAPFFNNSRQYFGTNPTVTTRCAPTAPSDCIEEFEGRNAVVFYRRGGFYLGTGRTIGSTLTLDIGTQLEWIYVTSRPEAASEVRGSEIRPIDFSILPNRSFASVLRVGLTYDRRDDPGLPTQGTYLRVQADAGTRLLGSAYDFVRLQAEFRQWVPLASHHTLRMRMFGGIVLGDAPFFYKFHASDLTDLIPSRLLEMQLDRRAPPNLLGTAIAFMRNEEVAVRADVEYDVSLLRHDRRVGLRGAHAYFNLGAYLLADLQDLQFAVPGLDGASRIPIDLTFDIGIRLDTSVGVFQFGFSNLLGFIQL
ncbi:MAG: BamA/TamA family outer membrane protein [Polyangiales bacterium]|nr:BamA/TamA family outer membrane protein [Myxococcales bacterium]MCB9659926.1 BamA/TamA family outer membrane protein [Sandaracinaceae bacterium]